MNRKFDILVDSACDMPKSYLDEHEIACVKLGFTMNNVNYEGEGGGKSIYQCLHQLRIDSKH